jgi:hypothetical protein
MDGWVVGRTRAKQAECIYDTNLGVEAKRVIYRELTERTKKKYGERIFCGM